MSENPVEAFSALAAQAQQLGANLLEAARPARFEYKLVAWEDVNVLAAEGWELQAADVASLRFVMGRRRGAADEAEAMLRKLGGPSHA